MNIRKCAPTTLCTLLLALAGCDGAPVEPQASIAEDAPLFAKAVFKRCKPHVNPAPAAAPERAEPAVVAVAPQQSVDVDLGGYSRADGNFRAQLLGWETGQACGQARLEVEELYVGGGTGILVYIVVFSGATVREVGGLTVVELVGEAEVCSEREGECRIQEVAGTVAEQPNDDEPIWQLHGGGAYSSFLAETELVFPGPAR